MEPVTLFSGVIACLLAIVAGAAGGALSSMAIGGEYLGKELAAMMGAFYGPIAALPGVLLALVILAFI
jgi:outer membrane lipoprotein SlyB